jgi:hypothetical protein
VHAVASAATTTIVKLFFMAVPPSGGQQYTPSDARHRLWVVDQIL